MKICGAIKALWRRMKIRERMIVLFFCLSLFPMLLVGTLFYHNMNEELMDEYSSRRQSALEQAWWSYDRSLRRIENIGEFLQSNPETLEFISGDFIGVDEEVYILLEYVQPIMRYLMMNYDEVNSIYIYNDKDYDVHIVAPMKSLGTPMRSMSELPDSVREQMTGQSYMDALWIAEETEDGRLLFKMYRRLFNFRNARECGILELEIRPEAVLHFFEDSEDVRMFFEIGSGLWRMENGSLTRTEPQEQTGIVNTIDLNMPDGRVICMSTIHQEPNVRVWQFIVEFLVLFMLSSVQFLIFNFSFAKRLRRFTMHMTKRGNDLMEYSEPVGEDEIDLTIRSYNEQVRRIRESVEREYVLALRNKEIEYYALQAQIKPHFIFNTLENIRMNSMLNGDTSTPEMLCALGEFVRYNAHVMQESTLWWEMENVRQYLRIFSFRTSGEFTFTEQISLDIGQLAIPQFVLQPVVENAVDHGFAGKAGEKCIRIRIDEKDGYVYVEISDNGIGIAPDALERLRQELGQEDAPFRRQTPGDIGIGLNNVNQRLKLFYGPDCGLSVESEENAGTRCTLKIKKIVKNAS